MPMRDTASVEKIIQKPVSVFFSFSSARHCLFIIRERERAGGGNVIGNEVEIIEEIS